MALRKISFFIIGLAFILTGCDSDSLYKLVTNPPPNPDAKYFTSFKINGYSGSINKSNYTIMVNIATGTVLTSLVPVFSIEGDHVEFSGTTVDSGVTTINFSSAVTLTVYALNGTSQDYTVTVTATAPGLSYIEITPASVLVEANSTVQLTATAHYTDSSTLDVTSAASWSSSNTAAATVASGLVTATVTGSTIITADYSGFTDTTTVAITTQTHFYVSASSGNDTTGVGSIANPYLTIQKGINMASSGCTVHVALGTYFDYITMAEGVSVYGSYSSDFSTRDVTLYTSTINPSGGYGVYFDAAISSGTILDGFEIIGSGGAIYAGIYLTSSATPVIQNNLISGGSNGSGITYGIYVDSASPTILKNEIYGGNSASGYRSAGIYVAGTGSAPTIINNLIAGGSGEETYGIMSNGSTGLIIRNNTINAGAGTMLICGIYLATATSTVIQNNILFKSGTGSPDYGIFEADAGSDPTSVENNDILSSTLNATYGFSVLYYDYDLVPPTITLVGDLNTNEGFTTRASNVIVDPVFDDIGGGDWHLTPASPPAVTQGGLTIGGITDDIENTARTDPWSMGAYEYD